MRRALERDDLEVVAVNDLTDARTLAHLLEFDSTYGRLGHAVGHGPDSLTVDGRTIAVLSSRDPAGIDWGELGVSVVIESTGKFRAREDAAAHLKGGARKVLISAPGKGADLTVVVGVNDGDYDPQVHDVISAASCTTNCVVPMAKVLLDSFGLAGRADDHHPRLHGRPDAARRAAQGPAASPQRRRQHHPDQHRRRPHRRTGHPGLAGRLDGVAVRVPVPDGSLTDLTAVLGRDVTPADVNRAFEQAASGSLSGVLHYSTDPLVSRDIVGDPASCVFDSGLTQAAGNLVKIFGWYDNEWGYTSRLVDLAAIVAARWLSSAATPRRPGHGLVAPPAARPPPRSPRTDLPEEEPS